MHKFSLFIVLIMVYLGLSKSFSPSELKTPFLKDERMFEHFFKEGPVEVLLIRHFQTGFVIKTHFLKLKIIHPFRENHILITRTSRHFWQKTKSLIGLSLFRKDQRFDINSSTPSPPGALFIGDSTYGKWKYDNSGQKKWFFHRAYRHFPKALSWDNFRPNYKFYKSLMIHINNNEIFYGLNNEFKTVEKLKEKSSQFNRPQLKNGQTKVKNFLKKYISLSRGNL